jgi:hypothetical protein
MKNLVKLMQAQFDKMCAYGVLFRSSVTGEELWALYMKGFGSDPIFRDPNSSVHNCNLCNNFIRRYGNIVALDTNLDVVTMFDVDGDSEYDESLKLMSGALKQAEISNIFFESYAELNSLPYEVCKKNNERFKLGVDVNHKIYNKLEAELYGVVKESEVRTFHHFSLSLPKAFVLMNESAATAMSRIRSNKEVLKRGLDEISLDTLELVKDLINQGSLLNGDTYLSKVSTFIQMKKAYDKANKKDRWTWSNASNSIAGFRNELIGTLCVELSEGKEINEACKTWNYRVDPVNYMKATAPITKRQIEEAKKFVEENGYEESFDRRAATIDDIKASEILHINVGTGEIKPVSVFDGVKSTSTRHKRNEFANVEEIGIDKFMKDILPSCTSVEAYFENRMEGNMVTLTTANNPNSKPIFKWSNNYSWTFKGNIAGKSEIKENVKKAGGKIDAVLRCSLQWNDEDTQGIVDLDLHCIDGTTGHICFSNKVSNLTGGWLDVDMIRPHTVGIENITWQRRMPDTTYLFYVKNYCGGKNRGFKAEIEFDGNVFNYHYNQPVTSSIIKIAIATVKNGIISIVHHLPENHSSRDVYGISTNEFHKMDLVCLSPNCWGTNDIGHKHYFFMLNKCICTDNIRTFHNENLKSDLLQHRKVMEVLGSKTMITPGTKQLSGLGFNATVRDEVILRLKGSFNRVVKVKF